MNHLNAAFPIPDNVSIADNEGLSKLELVTAMLLQGLLSHPDRGCAMSFNVSLCKEYAEELFKQLNLEKPLWQK